MFRKIAFGIFLFFVVLSLVFAFKSNREVTTNSDQAYTEYLEGQKLLDQAYYREASVAFEKAVAEDTNFAMAYARLAGCYNNLGFNDKATEMLNRAFSLMDKVSDREKMALEMWQCEMKGDTATELQIARKYCKEYPDFRDGFVQIGSLQMNAGNYEAAIESFLKASKADPKYANAYNMLGYLNYYLGRYDEALQYLEKYSQMAPDEANPHDSRGEILHALGRYQEAIAEFREAYNINPDFDYALEHMAFSYLALGKKSQVEYCLQTLVDKAPSDNRRNAYYRDWANCLLIQHEYDSAQAIDRLVLANDPASTSAYHDLGYTAYLEKDLPGAQAAFDSMKIILAERMKKEPYIKENREYQRGVILVDAMLADLEGNLDSALTLFSLGVDLTSVPNVKLRTRYYYADVLRRAGKIDLAKSELQKNLSTNPNHDRSLLLLADIYDAEGQHESARSYRQRVLEIWKDADPDFKPLILLRKKIAGEVAMAPSGSQS